MKNLKKICGIFLTLLLTSCTSMNTQGVFERLGNIFEEENGGGKVVEIGETEKEYQVLTSENVKSYLGEIKNRLKRRQRIEVREKKYTYDVLIGEYLVLSLDGETRAKITTFPVNTTPRVKISGNKLYFRTIYKGGYGIDLYNGAYLTRKINIVATSKNNFSESNIYDIILENSAKNNDILKDAVTLYKIYYPNGKNYKKVSYKLLEYGYKRQDKQIINEALNILKSDMKYFDDEQKKILLNSATLTGKRIFVPRSVYMTKNTELKEALARYIKAKDILDKKDKIFMQENFPNFLDEINKKSEIEENIENDNKETIKIINSKVEESKNKIKDYKKELSKQNSKDRKVQIYYNLMNKYVNSGDKAKALRYLSLIKQGAPNSELAKNAERKVMQMK